MPIKTSGMTAMIGARKMTSSRIKISRKVASPTMASALLPDCSLSNCDAAVPVTPSFRPVPDMSGLMSARLVIIVPYSSWLLTRRADGWARSPGAHRGR
jgi:hypothetical protein